jgi:hypothetical protein
MIKKLIWLALMMIGGCVVAVKQPANEQTPPGQCGWQPPTDEQQYQAEHSPSLKERCPHLFKQEVPNE